MRRALATQGPVVWAAERARVVAKRVCLHVPRRTSDCKLGPQAGARVAGERAASVRAALRGAARCCLFVAWLHARCWAVEPAAPVAADPVPLMLYQLRDDKTVEAYDEAVAVACLQGLINREGPQLYVTSSRNSRPAYWLERFSAEEAWLADRPHTPVADLDELRRLAGERLRGVVIWDPAVPATINVATTIAGVEDGVALSPALADRWQQARRIPVIADLRGRFSGVDSGSKKNDAYRWAIREYLARGRCSARWLCLYEDAFSRRAEGDIGYAITRDWAVKNRAFVFDLSPWGDEQPQDDPGQPLGTDLQTYRQILAATSAQAAGRHMTELTGFFAFSKYANMPDHPSRHDPVPTEWETVWLISPFNVYQNTSSSDCFNQSLHSHAPRRQLRQQRASPRIAREEKIYLCILMADYDSSYALYDLLPKFWDDPQRGSVPLAWGVNPNLLDTFPDLVAYFYKTMTPADAIAADACAAGYINPSRILPENLALFVRHNQAYFREADLTVAPMVLDWVVPAPAVKNAFQQFAPDGMGAMVWDMHANRGEPAPAEVWKGMPIIELINDANEFPGPDKTATLVAQAIEHRGARRPGFYFLRLVWTSPSKVREMLDALRRQRPDWDFEVLDMHAFFASYKQSLDSVGGAEP